MTVLADNFTWTTDSAHHTDFYVGAHRGLVSLLHLGQTADANTLGDGPGTLEGIIARPVLRRLLAALQFRDPGTVRHSRRVALLAVALAEHLGWEGRQLKTLEVAALLHDIGKIGVPDSILFKPAKLSPDELELMSLHYGIALDVLQACRVDADVLQIVSQSQVAHAVSEAAKRHEAHLGARILAVADAYESLSAARTYRRARPHDAIMEILQEASGRQFDGNIVNALSRHVALHGLPFAAHVNELDETMHQRRPATIDDLHEANELCYIFSNLYVLESLYDGFFVVDADLRILCWNRGAENLLGYSLVDMYGKPWTSRLFHDPAARDALSTESNSLVQQVLQTSQPVVAMTPMCRCDGRTLEVDVQAVPLLDEQGRLQAILQILRDQTRSGRRRSNELCELKLAASRDALTALANRGELETQLTAMVTEFARTNSAPFCVIFADADHFKSVNDSYGHAVGDQVLIDIARLLQQETYSGEVVGRYGGEEFVILCPDTLLSDAVRRAERIRHAIGANPIGGVDRLRVTASFGVAEIEPGDSVESVLRRADKALYNAKHSGRNRTCSLTNADMLKDTATGAKPKEFNEPFRFVTSFQAVVGADMVVYKLGGFIHDHQASIARVTRDRAVLRAGSPWLFGLWGSAPAEQPVEIELHFPEPVNGSDRGGRATIVPKMTIQVRIRPLGWVRSSDAFQLRAFRVTQELKHYFCAE